MPARPGGAKLLCAEMDRNGYDILRFDFDVHAQGELSAERREWFARNRCRGKFLIGNRTILFTFFSGRGGMLTLLDRIYRGDVCRRAFARTEDVHLTYAEDLYEFFAVAFHAHRYGEFCRPLYRYNLSTGIASWQNCSGASLTNVSDSFFAGLVKRAQSYVALSAWRGWRGERCGLLCDLVSVSAHFTGRCDLGSTNVFCQSEVVGQRDCGKILGVVLDVLDKRMPTFSAMDNCPMDGMELARACTRAVS